MKREKLTLAHNIVLALLARCSKSWLWLIISALNAGLMGQAAFRAALSFLAMKCSERTDGRSMFGAHHALAASRKKDCPEAVLGCRNRCVLREFNSRKQQRK
ncbi:hypothetical protein [Paenibacillus sacheonensis]|uniref:Uncharacterized protein n=1 Tax=Paenibacillus sacheonensis TaxID=742054 RepID=A0A7X4YUM7_9BACL|nr:hypothetical protein [Paenibacillus sacheonensis]MBM7568060.1 hypothetical protein [Paenibacillus sacheonensis]NBC72911.1 hypothetical protein [Paenibacillus sacheonensis]